MVLPAMGVVSEVIANFSRKNIFGYKFVGLLESGDRGVRFSGVGHHLFVASQSVYAGMIFSFLSFAVAIPSAIKVSTGRRRSTKDRFPTTRRCCTRSVYRSVHDRRHDGMFLASLATTCT
jgi:hypothetical protein